MPRNPIKWFLIYLRIFGFIGIYYALIKFITKRKTIVRVAAHWSPHPLYVRLNSSDIDVFRQVFIEREYQLVTNIPGTLEVIIDAGANIGLTSVYLSTQYPEASIYAIEPEGGNFQLLKMNTKSLERVHGVQGALWNKDELVDILSPNKLDWAFRIGNHKPHISDAVPGYRVRSFANAHGLQRISLLKMDIEGAEVEVLNDAKDWIGIVDNIVVELHERFRPGCEELFMRHTSNFAATATSGELTLVSRSEISPI